MTATNGAKILLETLKSWGVRYVFGSIGEELGPFLDEIARDKSVKFFDSRHEESGVFTAIGYSWIAKVPSVCIGTVGPGVANMFNGFFVAWRQSVPVIGIVPKHSPDIHQSIGFKSFEQTEVYRHVTKWSVDCDSLEHLQSLVNRAVRTAAHPPTGPAMVSINELLFEEKTVGPPTRPQAVVISSSGSSQTNGTRKAAQLLVEAELPVIIADTRTVWNGAIGDLGRLADELCIPVLSATRAIRPMIPESSPLSFGLFEPRSAPPALEVMERADVLLAVDCYFDSFVATGELLPRSFLRRGRFPDTIIQIDSDPSMIGKNYPVEVGIVGDSGHALKLLLKEVVRLKTSRKKVGERLDAVRRMRHGWTEHIKKEYRRLKGRKPINPLVLAVDINRSFPKDCIISVAGAFNSVVFNTLDVYRCDVPASILGIGVDGSLGTGLCKAMGAKLAAPRRTVAAFLGDGEFWYGNASELETLARTGLPVVTIISNNGSFGSDKYRQLKMYDGRFIGVDFSNPDFAKLARVFGLHGERVEEPEDIAGSLSRAVASGKPAIIDVVTELSPPPTFRGGASPV